MMSRTSPPGAYVAHFGFDLRTLMALIGCVVAAALLVWWPADDVYHWVLKVASLLVFAVLGLWVAVNAVLGGVAFSADVDGITLGSPRITLPPDKRRPIRVPWRDLAEVVLFDQIIVEHRVWIRIPHVGLRLRSGARTTATSWEGVSMIKILTTMPHRVGVDVVRRSLPVRLWRLDERRLCEAVNLFAPDVRVVRLDESGQPHPVVPA